MTWLTMASTTGRHASVAHLTKFRRLCSDFGRSPPDKTTTEGKVLRVTQSIDQDRVKMV